MQMKGLRSHGYLLGARMCVESNIMRNPSFFYREMNRLGLKGEPAPQPQHTLLSSPKKRLPL